MKTAINLAASMRTNLLSLQSIARQNTVTQNRLTSGLKVNSAIDNPSSYYTSRSLQNRANDLTGLLDSMKLGIQTVKSATQTLEQATKILDLAAADLSQLKTAGDAAEFFRVDNAAELRKALADVNVEKIIITNSITFADNETLVIPSGKTVYGLDPSVELNFNARTPIDTAFVTLENNSALKNIKLSGTKKGSPDSTVVSVVETKQADIKLDNVFIKADGTGMRGLNALNSTIRGSFNIDTVSFKGSGAVIKNTILKADVNIRTVNYGLAGIRAENSDIEGNFNIYTTGNDSSGIELVNSSISGVFSYAGKFSNILTSISSTIKAGTVLKNAPMNKVDIKHYSVTADVTNNISNTYTFEGALAPYLTSETSEAAPYIERLFNTLDNPDPDNWDISNETPSYKSAFKKYSEIIEQYDQLINDAGYKGVNLLKDENLKIVFNENGSSTLEIIAVDASSKGIGLNQKAWLDETDIDRSATEIKNAITLLRMYSGQFGNYYQTVSIREGFTKSLINLLNEGADNLVLADMNQESANMLAIQTRQQLAVNALSLASQAAQGILKLF